MPKPSSLIILLAIIVPILAFVLFTRHGLLALALSTGVLIGVVKGIEEIFQLSISEVLRKFAIVNPRNQTLLYYCWMYYSIWIIFISLYLVSLLAEIDSIMIWSIKPISLSLTTAVTIVTFCEWPLIMSHMWFNNQISNSSIASAIKLSVYNIVFICFLIFLLSAFDNWAVGASFTSAFLSRVDYIINLVFGSFPLLVLHTSNVKQKGGLDSIKKSPDLLCRKAP
ncbi:MAG TPA: hypothetical protein DCM07_04330, partial [Planctomycetaceae bacterium]|nr:hypothetical protein [Planctomycetaceae bacterium]HBL42241.1 hypothetical protein [Planctomycetaceae bacterium]